MGERIKKAVLALADGTIFKGESFGARGEAAGEVVFNTSMTGYQEILSDPSYKGQIVTMTYPLIGNYGINTDDFESAGPQVEGFIVKEGSEYYSNWRANKSLDQFLKDYQIVGIQNIDTRALTRHIRNHGAQQGIITGDNLDSSYLVQRAKNAPSLIGRDLVKEVTCSQIYSWEKGTINLTGKGKGESGNKPANPYKVLAYDFGIKHNILRMLVDAGCAVTVVPADTPAEKALELNPDGIFLSNGPGDPEGVPYAINEVKKLIGKKPIFGICLGHQILGLALGGSTYKLKFGHHGGNQPVMDLNTGKVEITAQNHGFAVDIKSFSSQKKEVDGEIILTHTNLNDHTVEGMRHRNLPIFSVQYHPEASPGPHDSGYLFERFIKLMKAG